MQVSIKPTSFTTVKLAKDSNPITLKNQRPGEIINSISHLTDVAMDNAINNSVLIYNEADEKFHVDQLSLDGGSF